MHLFATNDPTFPIFFNLNTSVGKAGQNTNIEDVLLVQWLLKKLVERMPATTPEGKAADDVIRRMQVTGSVDPTTITAIESFQNSMKAKNPGVVVDGRMSPAKGIGYGSGVWSIAQLNNFIRKSCQDKWPRLQDFKDCPGSLQVRFQEIL